MPSDTFAIAAGSLARGSQVRISLPIRKFDGPVWRLLPQVHAQSPTMPVSSPEGRFHYSEQIALYASLSPEGAMVAIQRYLSDKVARVLIPLWLTAERVADARGIQAASIVWQDLRHGGRPSPTWSYSDTARRAGAEAMLYSSRSRPDLSHVVVFHPECLRAAGPPTEYKSR